MLKGHPKGLLVMFFSNMGERFGYYTMLAVFVLYLQAKFGYTTAEAGGIYGGFLFGIYFLPLLGGYVADNILGYGKTIALGTVVMFLGYVVLALPLFFPDMGLGMVILALVIISLGTGFFKGNLQALVGNLYDDPRYSKNRDNAFNIFYMGINIGAFFAPSAANAMGNWWLGRNGLEYSNRIPSLAHKYLGGDFDVTEKTRMVDQLQGLFGVDLSAVMTTIHANIDASMSTLTEFAVKQGTDVGTHESLSAFSHKYISVMGQSYNAAFGLAAVSMIGSLLIFVAFRKYYKHADLTEKQKAASEEHRSQIIELTPKQTRDRLVALGFVFFVVMFFWMSFHQNGFSMTIFARDYTQSMVSRFDYLWFDLATFLPIIAALGGLIMLLRKTSSTLVRGIGAVMLAAGVGIAWHLYNQNVEDTMQITPQLFQQFNPIFIVFMTPLIVGLFTWLRRYNKEPSAPRKIGIGMIITAVGFAIMMIAAFGLESPGELQGGVSDSLVSPYWLMSTYFTLTIAELFLSPMGISFVSKVAPPKYKGLMQGGWLGATAIGNLGAGLIGPLWDMWELWQFFLLLVVLCALSASFMFFMLKKLERITNEAE